MKKKLYNNELFNLKHYKNKMLILHEIMFYIEDYKIETEDEVIKGNWFRKEKTITHSYLTDIRIVRYFPKHNTLGVMQKEDGYHFILFYNLAELRQSWLDFKKQLKFFDLKLQKIKKEN